MPDIGNIGSHCTGGVGPLSRSTAEPIQRTSSPAASAETASTTRGEIRDRVELSEHARWLDALRALPPVRADKVEEIRAAIANGTYETDDKLNAAIDRLIDDIAGT